MGYKLIFWLENHGFSLTLRTWLSWILYLVILSSLGAGLLATRMTQRDPEGVPGGLRTLSAYTVILAVAVMLSYLLSSLHLSFSEMPNGQNKDAEYFLFFIYFIWFLYCVTLLCCGVRWLWRTIFSCRSH